MRKHMSSIFTPFTGVTLPMAIIMHLAKVQQMVRNSADDESGTDGVDTEKSNPVLKCSISHDNNQPCSVVGFR